MRCRKNLHSLINKRFWINPINRNDIRQISVFCKGNIHKWQEEFNLPVNYVVVAVDVVEDIEVEDLIDALFITNQRLFFELKIKEKSF